MSDADIIKALKLCTRDNIVSCDGCPFEKQCENDEDLEKYALDLINRQKERIKDLENFLTLAHRAIGRLSK